MAIHVALLRGINVGGRNKVAMSELRKLLDTLGFARVQTLLQSGNAVFDSDQSADAALERLLEIETERRLDVSADYLVRSAQELLSIVARNPFPDEAEHDPGHLVVVFLKKAAQAKDVKALQAAIKGLEIVRGDGKQLYAVYPAGIGRSKLTLTLIERKLATRGTVRNWNTVLKLAALCE